MDAGNASAAHHGSLRGGPVPLGRPAPPDALVLPDRQAPHGGQAQPGGGQAQPGNPPQPGSQGQQGSQELPGNHGEPGSQAVPDRPVLPEFVIVPAHPDNGSTEIAFEVRQAANGTDVLPVFSSVRHLVNTLGPAQPWVAMPLIKVRELAAAGGIQQVVLDPETRSGAWRWQYSDLETLEQSLGS
jgi:hypothetical protein